MVSLLPLQYGSYQRRILVEELTTKWKRLVMNTSVTYSFLCSLSFSLVWHLSFSDLIMSWSFHSIYCIAHNTIRALRVAEPASDRNMAELHWSKALNKVFIPYWGKNLFPIIQYRLSVGLVWHLLIFCAMF